MDIPHLKIPLEQLIKEDIPDHFNCDKYSHPAFRRKLPPDFDFLSDVSLNEKMLELEYKSGERFRFDFEHFFGKVIMAAEQILLKRPDGGFENLSIFGVAVEKIKRTTYLKLILVKDLPF